MFGAKPQLLTMMMMKMMVVVVVCTDICRQDNCSRHFRFPRTCQAQVDNLF